MPNMAARPTCATLPGWSSSAAEKPVPLNGGANQRARTRRESLVRTSARALRRSVEVMIEWVGADTPVLARVIHAAAFERGQQLADLARESLKVLDIRIADVPPVLGAHVGPGTASLCCVPVEVLGI